MKALILFSILVFVYSCDSEKVNPNQTHLNDRIKSIFVESKIVPKCKIVEETENALKIDIEFGESPNMSCGYNQLFINHLIHYTGVFNNKNVTFSTYSSFEKEKRCEFIYTPNQIKGVKGTAYYQNKIFKGISDYTLKTLEHQHIVMLEVLVENYKKSKPEEKELGNGFLANLYQFSEHACLNELGKGIDCFVAVYEKMNEFVFEINPTENQISNEEFFFLIDYLEEFFNIAGFELKYDKEKKVAVKKRQTYACKGIPVDDRGY